MNIIEQCMEWKVSLQLNFIDFEKAFDSVHRATPWRLLRLYGKHYKETSPAAFSMKGITTMVSGRNGGNKRMHVVTFTFSDAPDWALKETTSN